jgi:hypothetical protein
MIEQLIHVVKLRQAEIGLALAQGGATTWESYQRIVGEWQGMQYILDSIDKILEEERND